MVTADSIKVLDQSTINKIAAGEVIERPAAALKELLENSADSLATKIEIDFEQGGKKYLKVTDNGKGIRAEEFDLAIERHATSKLNQLEDLETLTTFGFRGEALASLAAVSRFTMHSTFREKNSVGRKVSVVGGVTTGSVPAPAIEGTTVLVEDLFFNVPARMKFLKSDGGETSALKRVIKQFALSHPEVTLSVRQNQKLLFHWPSQNIMARACAVLELAEKDVIYLDIDDRERSMRLRGVLAIPEKSLPTQGGLWFFVQGRPVTDRTLSYALLEGYRHLLMNHQYPQAMISLAIDPKSVDVNVHPTKAQVKFLDSSSVFRLVSRGVRETLEENLNKKSLNAPELLFSQPSAPVLDPKAAAKKEFQPLLVQDHVVQYNKRDLELGASPVFSGKSAKNLTEPVVTPSETVGVSQGSWGGLQLIGQLANTYLVCQAGTGLVMVDQHAAHERVLFERIKKQFELGAVEKQMSLLGELIELESDAIEALTSQKSLELLLQMGFELYERGPTTLAVSSRPAFLADVGLKPLFERLGEQVSQFSELSALHDLRGEIWSSMACHGAIRAGRVLSPSEMRALLTQMDEFTFSSFCPHGRPVSVRMGLHEIEKLFKRIV